MIRYKFWTFVSILALIASAQAAAPAQRTPVLVELFTSEGCSSCPPADTVLAFLDQQQPVAGVEIIAMSEHVDYWNSLGWADPFSSAQFSQRQDEYHNALHNAGDYTPQMIIDGQMELLGSDKGEAIQTATRAGKKVKLPVNLTRNGGDTGSVKLQVRMDASAPADVYLAITENNLSNNVARGENEGRKLSHVAVVRKLVLIGHTSESAPFASDQAIRLDPKWKPADLSAVVFVQARKTRAVLAAASVKL